MIPQRMARLVLPLLLLALLSSFGGTVPASGAALPSGQRAPADVFTVTNTYDEVGECTEGSCSLRQAINAANEAPGSVIAFAIPVEDPGYNAGTGQWTVTLSSPLPALGDGTAIDATTQPAPGRATIGQSACPLLRIIVDASLVPYGFEVTGAGTEITGMVIQNAQSHGVYIHGSNANGGLLLCNQIVSNGGDGLRIGSGASGIDVGNDGGYGNLISGNSGDGVEITGLSHQNTLVGNTIGTDSSGSAAWANGGYGVHLSNGAMTNTVGIATSGGGNLISGNTLAGVLIASSTYTSSNNSIVGNYIGVDTGGGALPNQDGVVVSGAPGNVISGNLISGNANHGIRISGSAARDNIVELNTIGTDAGGDVAQPNTDGVVIIDAPMNLIGPGNLISSNTNHGVRIQGSSAVSNTVAGNDIGINEQGTLAVPNEDGVVISDAAYNTVGPGNLISGNDRDGVRIEGGGAMYNVVRGNAIGINGGGDDRISNRRFGVLIQSEAHHNAVGVDNDGNTICGNGYDGDFAIYGGVGILNGYYNTIDANWIGETHLGEVVPNGLHGIVLSSNSQYNTIGEGTLARLANTIAWNVGDGIHIDGGVTLYNTIGRNEIYENEELGIDTALGGNRELTPPVFQQLTASGTVYTIQASACTTCTVLVYSDDNGEGQHFEGVAVPNPTSGFFSWNGDPAGTSYTFVATDADGNTSEFSPAFVTLELSIDDALSGVVVNKVAGDVDAPAGNTIVDLVATIVSYDHSLKQNLQVDLLIPGDVLGTPSLVFARSQPSSNTGSPIVYTNPSSGLYRVEGINLTTPLGPSGPEIRGSRTIVFRFAIPHAVSPGTVNAQATLVTTARPVKQESDTATLRLLQRADEIIITNRTQLYSQYTGVQDQVTEFLQDLYAFAQGAPHNWSPVSVVYYVDEYVPALASWNNQSVSYASESAANTAAVQVDSLIEDWVEDSTTQYQQICYLLGGCHSYPVDHPPYLLIAGDDHIVPFYRRDDPKGSENDHTESSYPVLNALRQNDYFFTDNYYGDLSYVQDSFEWQAGGVELFTGRLIGARPEDMSTLLEAGRYGPSSSGSARAIVASGCGTDGGGARNRLVNYGYDVRNDDSSEGLVTIDNDIWHEYTLLALLQQDYQVLHHANHASEFGWCTPPCDSLPDIDKGNISTTALASRIAANRPAFVSSGCRAGLSPAGPYYNTMATAMIHEGASAVMASTGISYFDSDYGDVRGGEEFVRDFWSLAASAPPQQLNMGAALAWNKRTWDGHWFVDDEEEKTGAEFVLYGVPWVTVPYRAAAPLAAALAPSATQDGQLSAPQAVAEQMMVVTATFDASSYAILHEGGFDLVDVEGMTWGRDTGMPLVPLAEVELTLPLDGALVAVETIPEGPLALGELNIPMAVSGVPIPGGEPGGLAEVPPEVGVYPPQPYVTRTVAMESYQLARVYASPLTYNSATDEAVLYQSLTIRITYHLSATVSLLELGVEPAEPVPGEPFWVAATLHNASDEPVELTAVVTVENSLGEVWAVQAIDPFPAPPGEPFPLEIEQMAPTEEGSYSLYLALLRDGQREVIGRETLVVSGLRLSGPTAPEGARAGQQVPLMLTVSNRRAEGFAGIAELALYTGDGMVVTVLPPVPLFVEGHGEAVAEWLWDGMAGHPGAYVAVATVTEEGTGITYGPTQGRFTLQSTLFLPLVIRDSP